MAITKPPVVPPWADANVGDTNHVVKPSDPEIEAGWPQSSTPPSRQRFNWILNFCANAVRYFSRRGIADYDADETYMTGDIVRSNDGLLRRSLVDSNTNHTPSSSPSQWGSPLVPTPQADDNSTKIASTAYVLGQLSVTLPVMDGSAAAGSSLKFARADHRHPSDTSKANTSGTYLSMTVGAAASASSVPFAGVTGKPTTCAGYGITDAITTATIGSQSVAHATTAVRARPRRSDNTNWDLIWSGQGGQPNWLVGSNDGVNFHVYNPANFTVHQANNVPLSAVSAHAASIKTRNFPNRPGTNVTVQQGSGPPNLAGSVDGDVWEYY